MELSSRFVINDNWEIAWTYAYTNAELTDDAPGLVGSFNVRDGARLPGHAEHQGTFNVTYSTVVFNDVSLDVNYGFIYSGDVYNIPGGDDDPLFDDDGNLGDRGGCLLYTSPSPRDQRGSRMPSSA